MSAYSILPLDNRILKEAIEISKMENTKVIILCMDIVGTPKIGKYENIVFHRLVFVNNLRDREKIFKIVQFWLLSFFILFKLKPDIIHAHDPTGIVGVGLYAYFRRKHIIYDSHELFPENALEVKGKLYYYAALSIEKFFSSRISLVLSVSNGLTEIIANRLGVQMRYSLPNFPSLDLVQYLTQKEKQPIITVVYSGTIHPNRGYELLIDALKLIKANYSEIEFQIVIVGDGSILPLIKQKVIDNHITNVLFTGMLLHKDYAHYIASSHVGLLLFDGLEYQKLAAPTKIYEYCHSGLIQLISSSMQDSIKKNTPPEYHRYFFYYQNKNVEDLASKLVNTVINYDQEIQKIQRESIPKEVKNSIVWEYKIRELHRLYFKS